MVLGTSPVIITWWGVAVGVSEVPISPLGCDHMTVMDVEVTYAMVSDVEIAIEREE